VIEAQEVIHVPVADENVGDPPQLAGREWRQVAKVEQQRTPLEHQLDQETRISEWIIHEMSIEPGRHTDRTSARVVLQRLSQAFSALA
jgi:hypothetical protein